MAVTAEDINTALDAKVDKENKERLGRFFKTGEGEYAANDIFLGVRVPDIREVCKHFADINLKEVQRLLNDPIHERRLAAVILLASKYTHASGETERKDIYELYLRNVRSGRVNNWDLVDSSAEFIVGPWLLSRPKDILFEMAASENVWERRVCILAAFAYVKSGDGTVTLALAEKLLHDKHDLIQKAVGWQLREVGKRVSRQVLISFLDKYAVTMPRTSLRYAIEHLSPEQRAFYMQCH